MRSSSYSQALVAFLALPSFPTSAQVYNLTGFSDHLDANNTEVYANDTEIGAKPINYPDLVICDRQYGEGLRRAACLKAFNKLPDGLLITNYVTQHSHVGDRALKVPYFYTDVDEGSFVPSINAFIPTPCVVRHELMLLAFSRLGEDPECVITVDLSVSFHPRSAWILIECPSLQGRSIERNKVKIRHIRLRDLAKAVNSSCLEINFGRGGFATYHMRTTVDGIAKLRKEPAGYGRHEVFVLTKKLAVILTAHKEAPLFLTLQISPRGSRKRPGNTDPRISDRLQEALDERIVGQTSRGGHRYTAYEIQKMAYVADELAKTRRRMRVNGDQVRRNP